MKTSRIVLWFLYVSSFSFCQTTLHVPQQYSTIQAALNAAQSGDTVLVEPGIYYENIIWPNVNGIDLIAKGDSSDTIIDGKKLGSVIHFSTSGITSATLIKGFSIRNGGNVAKGAGILINNANPTLSELLVYDNIATDGGGIYVSQGNPTINNCCVRNNYSQRGGAFFLISSKVTITYSNILLNKSDWYGGGINSYGGELIGNNVRFIKNISTDGGALSIVGGKVTLNNCSFIENYAETGGGISTGFQICTVNLINNLFCNNKASKNGSGIFRDNGDVTVNQSSFINNGSAIYNSNNDIFINAVNNYWGSENGPKHLIQNASGKGDEVNNYVNIGPWLSKPNSNVPTMIVQNFKVTSVENNSVSLSWSKSILDDFEGFKIYWDKNPRDFDLKNSINVGRDTSAVISNLLSGEKYYFSITCYDKTGEESWYSNVIFATTIPPVAIVSENKLYFGKVALGDSSQKVLQISSSNSSPLTILEIKNSQVAFNYNIITPLQVPSQTKFDINVCFRPSIFSKYQDTLYIITNGGTIKVDLTGESPSPNLLVNKNNIDFGQVVQNSITKEAIIITNTSINTLIIDSITIRKGLFSTSILYSDIDQGDTVRIEVSCTLNEYGIKQDTLRIYNNSENPQIPIPLQVLCPHPSIKADPQAVNFGKVTRNTSYYKEITIKNSSINTLVLDSLKFNTNNFTGSPQKANITYKDSLRLVIKCLPNEFGFITDTLHIFNNSLYNEFKIPLSANSDFHLVFNGANLNYGNVAVGDTIVQTISVGNILNERTIIDSIYTNSSVFQVSPSSITLDPLDTLELQIKFLPSAFMTYSDTVFIMNNALNTKLWISLTGSSPSPNAKTSSSEIVFDSTTVNSSTFSTLKISNASINCLEVKSIHTKTKVFQVSDLSTFVYRGDTLEIQIEFTPDKEGVFKDTLYIHNNSITGIIKIPLRGFSKQLTALCETNSMPSDFSLYQNYPNPFNPSTIIRYALPDESRIKICVYNSLGEMVSELLNQVQNAGYYEVEWNGGNRSSGIYFYSINAISESYNFYDTKKMLLIK